MNWHDIFERAGWTAAQAALGSLASVQLAVVISELDVAALEQAGLVAVGSAVAAVVSFLKTVAQERLGVLETRSDMIEDGH